jgi:hypothetical protein
LSVPTSGLDKTLNGSEAVKRFSVSTFTHRPWDPERLTSGQTAVTRFKHGPHFWTLAGHDEVGCRSLSHEFSQQAHMSGVVEDPNGAHKQGKPAATLKASEGEVDGRLVEVEEHEQNRH